MTGGILFAFPWLSLAFHIFINQSKWSEGSPSSQSIYKYILSAACYKMGGAVSTAPARDVASIAQNLSKTNVIFDNIARRGHELEDIQHSLLGERDDELCLTEIVLYLVKANDPFFRNFTLKPIVIIKEAYSYCFRVKEGEVDNNRIDAGNETLKMNRKTFGTFLLVLFWYSRLWDTYHDCDDKSQENKAFSEELVMLHAGNRGNVNGGNRQPIFSIVSWKEQYINQNSIDANVHFVAFANYFVENVTTPEAYFAFVCNDERKTNSDVEIGASDNFSTSVSSSKISLINGEKETLFTDTKKFDEIQSGAFGFSRSLQLNIDMSLISEDVDISHFSPINSNASIVIRSNSVPLTPMNNAMEQDNLSIGNNTCITNLSLNDNLCLSVNPLIPDYSPCRSMEVSSALCSLYGASLGSNNNSKKKMHFDSSVNKKQQYESYNELKSSVSSVLPCDSNSASNTSGGANTLKKWCEKFPSRRQLGWHALNKKREIVHHPDSMYLRRHVFVGEEKSSPSHSPVMIKSIRNITQQQTTLRRTESNDNDTNKNISNNSKNTKKNKENKTTAVKRSWRRSKGEKAPLWKPRHTISTKKKKISTIRTMQI